MSAQRQIASLERQEPTFYARIPKMVTMDLNPYELALYCNYKQTASEHGTAYKSNKTLATECKMSVRKVQDSRKSLAEKGLIRLEYKTDDNGVTNQAVHVTIVDVWSENHARYSTNKIIPMHVMHAPHAQDADPHAQDAPKEEPTKKNHTKETTTSDTDVSDSQEAKSKDVVVSIQDIIQKIALLSGVTGDDTAWLKATWGDYSPDEWLAVTMIALENSQKTSIGSVRKYLQGILNKRAIQVELDKQNSQPAITVPYHQPIEVVNEPEMSDDEALAFLESMRAVKEKSA